MAQVKKSSQKGTIAPDPKLAAKAAAKVVADAAAAKAKEVAEKAAAKAEAAAKLATEKAEKAAALEIVKAEKAAKVAAEKVIKEEKLAAEKAEKAAARLVEKTARDAKKEEEKATKLAADILYKETRDAKKLADKAERDAAREAKKAAKVNPAAHLIGKTVTADSVRTVNFRKGKTNVVECDTIQCTDANAAGRRLTVVFSTAGVEVMTRKVFMEWFEKMVEKMETPTPVAEVAPVAVETL